MEPTVPKKGVGTGNHLIAFADAHCQHRHDQRIRAGRDTDAVAHATILGYVRFKV
jgi:hypothetical protein